ncbi:MAG: phosphoribosylformylglycinamidine cyclo-ligase, partial [Candidatus Lindowbacteria bacterium]|nr:phosphoribosylformylglycinamidine cyclo-ligase [Candidatus Lindowbacteria bacterium]
IDGSHIEEGDSIIALRSSGLHTNGYSLVRKLLLARGGYRLEQYVDALGKTLADELLSPHKCYATPVRKLMDEFAIRGMAHITGGGLTDNIPRILPKTLDAGIQLSTWRPLPIFELIRQEGNIERDEMLRTFNMGVGMVLIVSPSDESAALKNLRDRDEDAWIIGHIVRGKGVVKYV